MAMLIDVAKVMLYVVAFVVWVAGVLNAILGGGRGRTSPTAATPRRGFITPHLTFTAYVVAVAYVNYVLTTTLLKLRAGRGKRHRRQG